MDIHDGVIAHLEPDTLEYEGKWTLGNTTMNKASRDDGIPAELFQILIDDAVKEGVAALNMPENLEIINSHMSGKGQFSLQSQGKAMPKNLQNYCTIVLISHTSEVMLKILQARLQQYMNQKLPNVQAGFRKGKVIRVQIANIKKTQKTAYILC